MLTAPAFALDIQEVTSPKGIKAWLVEDDSVPLISVRFSFKGGSVQDPEGKEGLANLMTGLFDEGAGDIPSDAYQERLDNIGAEMSFSASSDSIAGGMRMLKENSNVAFDMLALAIQKPRFDQVATDRIRSQIIAAINAAKSDPNTIASQKFAEVLYGKHPYARRDEGTVQSLEAITREDLLQAHKKLFGKDQLKIGVVGAISAQELAPLLDKLFGSLQDKAELKPVEMAKLALGATTSMVYDLPQTSVSLVYPGVKRTDPDFFAAYLMNQILGVGFTSRLYNEVREKRGLAYTVTSGLSGQDYSNSLNIFTGTRPDRAQKSLDVIRAEVSRMAKSGVTAEELAAAKSFAIGSYAINNLDSSVAVARTLVGLQEQNLGRDYIDRRAGLINAVTLGEVKAVAAKLLKADPAILVIGPSLN
ncbi:M16 family metallopeptidase [Pseudochrobactrum sp. MP213Fo]|uniref:M16 family metallopeptidase n=1 Tax=Pseudochrobactrum sp. MP213Fo TaxID=3022250 RepID=UPI003B9E6311